MRPGFIWKQLTADTASQSVSQTTSVICSQLRSFSWGLQLFIQLEIGTLWLLAAADLTMTRRCSRQFHRCHRYAVTVHLPPPPPLPSLPPPLYLPPALLALGVCRKWACDLVKMPLLMPINRLFYGLLHFFLVTWNQLEPLSVCQWWAQWKKASFFGVKRWYSHIKAVGLRDRKRKVKKMCSIIKKRARFAWLFKTILSS